MVETDPGHDTDALNSTAQIRTDGKWVTSGLGNSTSEWASDVTVSLSTKDCSVLSAAFDHQHPTDGR